MIFSNFIRHAFWPAHEILLSIAHAHMPLIYTHAGVLSEVRGLHFGPIRHLHPHYVYMRSEASGESCFVYASRKTSDESAHMRRLA